MYLKLLYLLINAITLMFQSPVKALDYKQW